MAGSLQNFIYTLDGGAGSKALKLDESNTRALGYTPANGDALADVGGVNGKVRKFTPRYINLEGITADGKKVTRRLTVPESANEKFQTGGTLDLPVLTGAGNDTVETVSFTVLSAIGETRSFYASYDTGLDDGTSDGDNAIVQN